MKWMLLVVVFGTVPVKTNLVFDSLDACLEAEEVVRSEYARTFNRWLEWAKKNPTVSHYPDSQKFMQKRIGMEHLHTCIPHAEARNG